MMSNQLIVITAMLASLLVITNLIWFVNYKRLNEEWLKTFLEKESELSVTRNNLMRVEIEKRGFRVTERSE